jgi:hypothetical protein
MGEVVYGSTPHKYTHHKQSGKCKINSTTNWECFLNSINIGSSSDALSLTYNYKVNSNVMFNPTQGFIYVPYEFIAHLLNTLFKHQIEQHKCWIEDEVLPKGIVCSYYIQRENIFNNITLSFIIDGYIYTTYVKNMFIILEDYLKFIIVEHPYDNNNTWELGGFFLQNFISEFNYDTNCISLYSLNTNYIITRNNNVNSRSIMTVLLITNIMFLLIGIMLCLCTRSTYII